MARSIDTPRVYATKKNAKRVCERIAQGYTVYEAATETGTAPHAWNKWRKTKPEARKFHL